MAIAQDQRLRAKNDLRRIFVDHRMWRALAWSQIKSSYRLTSLGTFWITAATAIFVVSIGVIYGQFFGQDMSKYLPYFATGFILWGFISGAVTQATSSLIGAGNMIKASNMPVAFHVLKTVQMQFIVFLHNVVVLAAIWLFFRWEISFTTLLCFVGLAVTYVFVSAGSLLLALICVRFRDVPPLVQTIVQFTFFATPIIWYPETLRFGKFMLWLNPVAYFMMITRDPFLGRPVDPQVWLVALALTAVTIAATAAAYIRYRARVAYWV